ncbi:MAG: hypothetical protein EZS26_000047 [Candidatus Ordinivivax streblomastigis]|uniref:Reverse transcriptase domain-containing protein n=1 Tax=Candidatus Ordinivivax streblomastigis TaxID=2540710 RepID=A0A5M8P5G4_9BACT|nr:MAG: hypothetical protein EZS26_000047 [Candidatus Ordinivivax streblomastigis]
MRRIGDLIEKIQALDNLYLAYFKARKGKSGVQAVIDYEWQLDRNIQLLQQQIKEGNPAIGAYHYFTIYDPKIRLICASAFSERVLHHALMNICHPYFERTLIYDTYATRLNKGIYRALDKAKQAMLHYRYVAKLDFRKYFDSVSHNVLKAQLRRLFKDAQLLSLFDKIIDSYETTPGFGIPIGNLTSQYFANYYLSEMDHYAKEVLKIPFYIRYMDDILIFEDNRELLNSKIEQLKDLACSKLYLHFKPVVIHTCKQGISFLGYKPFPHKMLLNGRSKRRFAKKLRLYHKQLVHASWSEKVYQEHVIPLFAFAEHAYTKSFRQYNLNLFFCSS